MRVLIGGTGSIGRRHIDNIRLLRRSVEFVFLRENGNEDELSNSVSAQVVPELTDALTSSIDCAVVANPSAMHAGLVSKLIEFDIPIYIEKPVVTSLGDMAHIQQMISERRYRSTTLAGCNLRFLPSLKKVKQLLAEGAIGNIVRASLQVGQWLPDWRTNQDYTKSYSADPRMGGGVILDLIHELDAARWLLGDFDDVRAFSATCPSLEIQSEAAAIAIMRGRTTPITTLAMDYVSRKPVRRYEFVGDKGTLVWDLMTKHLVLIKKNKEYMIDCGDDGFDVLATYRTAMKSFLSAVESGSQLDQDISEGLKSVGLAMKVKEEASR